MREKGGRAGPERASLGLVRLRGVRSSHDGWRHMGGAHMRVEGVAVAVVSGLDSSGSPSALSVPRAHSTGRAALGGFLRCSALYASKAPDGQAADDRILGGVNRTARPVDADTSEVVQDHHSRRSSCAEGLRPSAGGIILIYSTLDPP